MNSKQTKTLKAIFSHPTPIVEWAAIENLFVAVGCKVAEGAGSRVRFELDGVSAAFHRPHPGKEARHYQVRAAREFLEQLGITP